MFIMFLLGGGGFLATYYGLKARDASNIRATTYEEALFNSTTIVGGGTNLGVGTDDVEDDGVIGNPKKYPKSKCELPDYQSKNGHIVAVSKNGTEVQMKIKGINWFGMETYVWYHGMTERINSPNADGVDDVVARRRLSGCGKTPRTARARTRSRRSCPRTSSTPCGCRSWPSPS
jgi:hypothetical protein